MRRKSSNTIFICDCGKTYKHRQSLSLHKKKCTVTDISNNIKNTNVNTKINENISINNKNNR